MSVVPYEAALTIERRAGLKHQFDSEKQALSQFSAALEEEFFELGALLRRITVLSRDVRRRSDDVIAAASGQTEDAAIQFTFQLLKKAEDLVHASREQHLHVFKVFRKMHLDLVKIGKERDALMDALLPLTSTTVQFRIQSAAFDDATRRQFFGLADTIAGIVTEVKTAIARSFEDLERTGQSTGDLLVKLAATSEQQEVATEKMLGESRGHLSQVNQALANSGHIARLMSEASARIGAGVGQVIVALQAQDMARQKIEHVQAAIDDMVSHLDADLKMDAPAAPEHDEDCRHFLASAARVQLSQLKTVFAQLDDAAGQVTDGLRTVESEAKQFAQHAVQAGNAMLDGHVIGRAVQSIHSVLRIIDNAVAGIAHAASVVQNLKSMFSDTTNQTLELARGLRLVSLNAQIFATQVEAGTALEAVAKNTRGIAGETMQRLHDLSAHVSGLVNAVVELEHRLNDYRELANLERSLLAVEADQSEQKLHSLEQQLQVSSSQIGQLDQELAETLRRAGERVRFPAAVAESSARSVGLFQGIALEFDTHGNGAFTAAHGKVKELKRHYTMENEREVHESAFVKVAGSPEMPHSAEGNDDLLPDNVELF